MSNNEHEELNKGSSMNEPEKERGITPVDNESTISDLLHVLGVKKKKVDKRKPSRHLQNRTPIAAIEDDPELPVTLAPVATVPKIPVAFEKVEDGDEALLPNSQEEADNETFILDSATELPSMAVQSRKKMRTRKIALITLAILIMVAGGIYVLPYLTEPVPPGEDVVASYNGKNVTIAELMNFIALEQTKESEHMTCEKHGYDHTQCTPDEKCESHPIDSIEGYQQMATNLAVEQIVQEWASTQGVTQREDVQHGIKDLLDNASVSQWIDQLHEKEITPESISSLEVQQYFDDNKKTYSGKSLPEVENEIRQILVSQKDEDFFSQYIEKLKQTAGLQVNFDLLKVTEPTDEEISAYYNQNSSEYQVAEIADALEIKIATGDAQNRAAEAIRKIRSGEDFDSVAAAYGQDGKANTLSFEKGSGEATVEAVIWGMQLGDVSDPITSTDGTYSIIKLVGISKAGTKPLSSVESDIKLLLMNKKMESEYTLRKDEALFSVHNRRYTLGDFYTEFKELPSDYQAMLSTLEKKQQLVEQLIAKELLLEETGDSSSEKTEQHSFDELKIQYLAQILHQQEVDDKLTDPTEDEMKKFYNKNKKSFITPAAVRISLIWIDQGQNGEKVEQAKQKADEALSLLNSGTDFSEVAKKYSEDGSAETGGEINGEFYQGYLPSELGTTVFDLQAGETSGVLDYNYGYYIIKVRERMEERQMTYEETTENIKEYLSEQKHSQLESEMEQVLLQNADFTIYNKTLRKLLKEQNK